MEISDAYSAKEGLHAFIELSKEERRLWSVLWDKDAFRRTRFNDMNQEQRIAWKQLKVVEKQLKEHYYKDAGSWFIWNMLKAVEEFKELPCEK